MKFSTRYVSILISITVGMWATSICLVMLPLINLTDLLKLIITPLIISILVYLALTYTKKGREFVQDFAKDMEKKYGKVRFTVCFILIALGVSLLILTGGAYLDMINWYQFLNSTWTYTFPQYVAVVPNPILKMLTQSKVDVVVGVILFWIGIFLIMFPHFIFATYNRESSAHLAMFILFIIALVVCEVSAMIASGQDLYHYWFNTFPNCEFYCNTTLLAVLGKCPIHNVTLCKLFNATAVRIEIPLDNPLSFPCYYKYKIINGLLFYRLNKTCIIELVLRKLKIMKR